MKNRRIVILALSFLMICGTAYAAQPLLGTSIPTISPLVYYGNATQNARSVSPLTKFLIGATATTTDAFFETPSLTVTGLTPGNCLQASTGGLVVSATSACGSGSGAGSVSTSSSETAGYVPVWFTTNGTPAKLTGTSQIFQNGNAIGIGTITPADVNSNSYLTVAGTGAQDVIASTTDNTTLSTAIFESYAPGSRIFMGAHGTNQVSTQYGIVVGGWGEIGSINSTFNTSNGLLIGTRTNAKPIVFGNNSLERMRIDPTGLVGIGTTTPWGMLSIHHPATGAAIPIFVVASSTASATTTQFIVTNAGRVGINNASPTNQLDVTGNAVITSASTTAFAVGPNGSTLPVLKVDGSVASSVTGISITGAATGGDTTIQTITDTGNAGLNLYSAANGTVEIRSGGSSSKRVAVGTSNNQYTNALHSFSGVASNSATSIRFGVTNIADLLLTAGTEAPWVYFNGANAIRTHSSNTIIATQRDARISGTTHAFQTSGGVITNLAALSVDLGSGGTNATITNNMGIYLPQTTVTNSTNGYGLNISAPTGATNNYAAVFLNGNVGVGTTSPWAQFSVNPNALGSGVPEFVIGSSTATHLIVDGGGRLGLATTSPWRTLSVVGTVSFNGLTSSASASNFPVCITPTNDIVNSGGTTCTLSSKYIKHDIEDLSSMDALKAILNLRPVSYIEDESGKHLYGFIAEEVDAIDPKLAVHAQGTLTIAGHTFSEGDPISVDYERMTAVIVKYLQDHAASAPIRSIEENWQWGLLAAFALAIFCQQVQINKLRK